MNNNSVRKLDVELENLEPNNDIKKASSETSSSNGKIYNIQDLYKIIQAQQSTINKLTQELTKRSQTIPREQHEKILNDLESEKYEHAKSRMEINDLKDKVETLLNETDFFKNELEKERCAYANVFELLKDKALNEGTKSIDLISKIAETEIKYNDALQDVVQKEKKYAQLCGKIKQKELSYEHKMQELNLKVEQDKYISKLINEQTNNKPKLRTSK